VNRYPLGAPRRRGGALLIVVLSVLVVRDYGGWVRAIGTARYALMVAVWAVPWLAAPLAPRYWGKAGDARRILGRSVVWLYRTGAGPGARAMLRRTR
jgi:hypothetical protein